MYRTLLATCGSAEMVIRRRCVQIVQTSVNRRATRCEQRAAFIFFENFHPHLCAEIWYSSRARCGTFPSQSRRFSFFSPRLLATRGRGSRDLRARVTRPAGAGHTTCGRGSLTMCRSETGMTQSGMAIPDIKIPHVAGFSWGCHVRNVRYVLCQCSSIE